MARMFDGTGDYVEIDPDEWHHLSGCFTISVDVRFASLEDIDKPILNIPTTDRIVFLDGKVL